MFYKITFNHHYDCIKGGNALIKCDFEFVKKNYYSFIIKTDKSYSDILAICINYDVESIKKCYIRNLFCKVV
jgi:hypothetical protein